MRLSVVIPAYNEAENLKILLPELHSVISSSLGIGYELIVIDAAASDDDSESVCILNKTRYIKQTNAGYADAFRTGIAESENELLLVVDADNSQDISKISQMYNAINNGADIAIGSRYTEGGKTDDPPLSVFMSKLLNGTYRFILGFNEKDISTDFRIYKKFLLKEIVTECDNFDVIEETIFLLKRKYPSLKVVEIPIHYRQRAEGISKRKLFRFIIGYLKLLIRLMRIKLRKKG